MKISIDIFCETEVNVKSDLAIGCFVFLCPLNSRLSSVETAFMIVHTPPHSVHHTFYWECAYGRHTPHVMVHLLSQ